MKKNLGKVVIIAGLIILAASFYLYYQGNQKKLGQEPTVALQEESQQNEETEYIEPGSTGRLMLMDLGSTGCVPCKMMMPILDELSNEYQGKVDIQFVDVYERQDLARKYKIYAIPTQIFFDAQGKEVSRHEGFFPKDEIIKKLNEMGLD